jgi:hypothetical protein
MQALPHRYRVKGAGRVTGDVELTAERLTVLQSASPAEFDGPGNRWSPETLLVGAVAYVDDRERSLADILQDPQLAPVVSTEGPIPNVRALIASIKGGSVEAPSLLHRVAISANR